MSSHVTEAGERSRGTDLVPVTTSFPADELTALDALAREQGRSRSELIREAVARTWLGSRPAALPATPDLTPGAAEDWKQRLDRVLTALETSAVTDVDERELDEFVTQEIEAHRTEKRARVGTDPRDR